MSPLQDSLPLRSRANCHSLDRSLAGVMWLCQHQAAICLDCGFHLGAASEFEIQCVGSQREPRC